jgi:hypothetical protein
MRSDRNKKGEDLARQIAVKFKSGGKLGFGTLVSKEIETDVGRVLLFDAMREHAASRIAELRDSCLPLYQALFLLRQGTGLTGRCDFPDMVIVERRGNNTHSRRHQIGSWSDLREAGNHFDSALALQHAMDTWATRCNVKTDWMMDAILRNLTEWNKQSPDSGPWGWFYPLIFYESHLGQYLWTPSCRDPSVDRLARLLPSPAVPPYVPTAQTRREHHAQVSVKLEQYYNLQENLFRMQGFKQTTAKRAKAGDTWEHILWFVEYQVLTRTCGRIAERYTARAISETAVYQAVARFAKIVKFRLRSKTSSTSQNTPA